MVPIIYKLFINVAFWPFFTLLKGPKAFKVIQNQSRALAWLLCHTSLRNEIRHNLELIYKFTPEQAEDKIEPYIYKMARYIYEVLALQFLNKKIAETILNINTHELDISLSKGHGCLILVTHSGNWELLGSSLAQRGYTVNAVVNSKDNFFEKQLDHNRQKNGVKLININKENMYRACLQALKRNEIVLIAIDTGATDSDKNITLPFLGSTLPIATGWVTLAMRTACTILPAQLTSDQTGLHTATFMGTYYGSQYTHETELLSALLPLYENYFKNHTDEWLLPLSTSEVKKSFGK